jgi:dolichol-phosphate mannosyltransferase
VERKLVIIPTYNEIENIEAIVEAVCSQSAHFHLLIVDDGSPDGTGARVKALQNQYPEQLFLEERSGKLGLGTAYIHGFEWGLARGYDYLFEMDADFSHNPQDLVALYEACAIEGFDVAIGSRYVRGVNVVNWPMRRVLMSFFASYYVKFITGMPIHDATAGFKCYRRRVLECIPLRQIQFVGYAFQIEMKFQAWKYGFRLKEVPIIFTERTRGKSKMSFKIFKEAFWGVISMKVSSLFKRYQQPMA